jgi:SSS family solute:Na+ symporter
VTQFFPGVVLGLFWERASTPAVFAGMVAGVAAVAFLALSHRGPFHGWSAGFLALCANLAITVAVSLLQRNAPRSAS